MLLAVAERRAPDDLSLVVDAPALAEVSSERAEIVHDSILVKKGVRLATRSPRAANHAVGIVDSEGRGNQASERADISHHTAIPDECPVIKRPARIFRVIVSAANNNTSAVDRARIAVLQSRQRADRMDSTPVGEEPEPAELITFGGLGLSDNAALVVDCIGEAGKPAEGSEVYHALLVQAERV